MIGFTRALAQENANKGITVNAVAPGYIKNRAMVGAMKPEVLGTDRRHHPARRLGEAAEVARCGCSWRPTRPPSSPARC